MGNTTTKPIQPHHSHKKGPLAIIFYCSAINWRRPDECAQNGRSTEYDFLTGADLDELHSLFSVLV